MRFQILPTTFCNARCFYCYEGDKKYETMDDQTVLETVNFIGNAISNENNKGQSIKVIWFGGEPLLAIDTISFITNEIRWRVQKKDIVSFEMVTNASLINEKMIHSITDNNISKVQVTLDGMGEEYEKRKQYKQSVSFSDIIEKIALLLQHQVEITIRINVDRNNIESCKKLILYLNERFGESVAVYVAPLFGRGTSYLSMTDVYETINGLQKIIQECTFKKLYRNSIRKRNCRDAHLDNYLIKPNGDIIQCEYMFDNADAVIGNVKKGLVKTIEDLCVRCPYCNICKYGCMYSDTIDCTQCWKSLWA